MYNSFCLHQLIGSVFSMWAIAVSCLVTSTARLSAVATVVRCPERARTQAVTFNILCRWFTKFQAYASITPDTDGTWDDESLHPGPIDNKPLVELPKNANAVDVLSSRGAWQFVMKTGLCAPVRALAAPPRGTACPVCACARAGNSSPLRGLHGQKRIVVAHPQGPE
jgi:hypothetical protein